MKKPSWLWMKFSQRSKIKICVLSVFSVTSSLLGVKNAWATASEKVELCFQPTAQGPEELRVNK